MKQISKSFAAAGVIISLLPITTFAAPNDRGLSNRGDFCQNLDAITARISSDMDTRYEKWDGKKTDRLAKISGQRANRDEVRGGNRADREVKQDERINALMAKADTDSERAAVEEFKTELDEAIEARHNAIDVAVETFRDGVDDIIDGKFGTLEARAESFRQEVNNAIEKAEADCADGKDSRADFMTAIKAARDNFKNTKPEVIKLEIQSLANTRKATVESAVNTFKDTMKAAFEELKTAFGGEIN